jgi:hypothetical protein
LLPTQDRCTLAVFKISLKKNLRQETVPVRLHEERARSKGKQVASVHYDDDVVYILICVFSSLSHLFRSFFLFFCFLSLHLSLVASRAKICVFLFFRPTRKIYPSGRTKLSESPSVVAEPFRRKQWA